MARANVTSAINDMLKASFSEDDLILYPLLNDAEKVQEAERDGDYIIYPIAVRRQKFPSPITRGTNPDVGQLHTSGVKVRLETFGDAIKEEVETLKVAKPDLMKKIVDGQKAAGLDTMQFKVSQGIASHCGILRADGNNYYMAFVNTTTASSGTNVLVSTGLTGHADDDFNGGRVVHYKGDGMGQGRCIQDYTDSTGTVASTTISAPTGDNDLAPPADYMQALAYQTAVADSSDKVPATRSFVSAVKNMGAGAVLNSDALMTADFYLREYFKAPVYPGNNGYNLYVTNYGWQQLASDPILQAIIQNYDLGMFQDPRGKAALGWMNFKIKIFSDGFRSSNSGNSNAVDAGYDEDGVIHYAHLCSPRLMHFSSIKINEGSTPGNWAIKAITEPDHTNVRPAYYTFSQDIFNAFVAQPAHYGLNIAFYSELT